jgi:eukaryotic-like serine/threonine-protein kinase
MENPSRVGKYELEKYLGGSMARVYRARDSVLGRRVALKLLSEAGMADPEAKQRFLQEARVASSIRHENIVSVYDFGEEHGRPYIVMEFVEGESLRDAIKNGHLGDLRSRLKIALAVAHAVDHIHTRKIIHRDLKPDNIHVNSEGKALLMDFGIAKAEGVHLTRAGFTLGTPYYMPPEQVLGKPLTSQADVYSYGILLYELLTGVRPVNGSSIDQIFQAILTDPLNMEPLKALKLPQGLEQLIERCTDKHPERRPAALSEVSRELQKVLRAIQPAVSQGSSQGGSPGSSQGITQLLSQPAPQPISPRTPPRPPAAAVPPSIPRASAPRSSDSAASAQPQFIEVVMRMLPVSLRTQFGLTLLSCSAVLVVMALLLGILRLADAI